MQLSDVPRLNRAADDQARIACLFANLYTDLCRLARSEVRRHGAHDLIGSETLVHEVWLKVHQRAALDFESNARFLAYAARMMRGVVIDHVRANATQKRGGGLAIVPLDDEHEVTSSGVDLLQQVSDALDELSVVEPELAQVVELKFFSGFTSFEIARMRGVSERTVRRQWEKARLVLYRQIRNDE